jgi:DNA polymerase-3 subunit epsilon
MREIVFDTETTGLNPDHIDPAQCDRIVEVGCIELFNYLPTGREFQMYINPGRPVSEATVRITGITNDTLRGKPSFDQVVDKLMDFFGDAQIVAHNAEFDRGFLNAELARLGRPTLPKERFVDTLVLAREHRPGSPASLDAVCKRFDISIKDRANSGAGSGRAAHVIYAPRLPRPAPLPSRVHPEEEAAHAAFVGGLGENAVWKTYS